MCRFNHLSKDQEYSLLLKIGEQNENARSWSPEVLGFTEIYFQFWLKLTEYKHIVFPLTDEAFLEQGFRLSFDKNWRLMSEPIPKMPNRLMRPTPVIVNSKFDGECELFMIGGDESRCSLKYETKLKQWQWLPKLPPGHPISCNICVNYLDRAIFSFTVDGKLNIKAAFLDLKFMQTANDKQEITQEMEWCLERKQEDHKIDRFHIKCAQVMNDGSIAVVARGRTPGMKMQVTTIVLRFDVDYVANKWTMKMRS